jgi:hypothetical protein
VDHGVGLISIRAEGGAVLDIRSTDTFALSDGRVCVRRRCADGGGETMSVSVTASDELAATVCGMLARTCMALMTQAHGRPGFGGLSAHVNEFMLRNRAMFAALAFAPDAWRPAAAAAVRPLVRWSPCHEDATAAPALLHT